MSDHPTTFHGEPAEPSGDFWTDRAAIHRADDGGGILDGAKRLSTGTLAEMVALLMTYPPEERGRYVIEKMGDHRLTRAEVEALAARADFPHARG